MSNTENNEIKDDLEYIDLNDTPSDDEDNETESQETKSTSSKVIHILFGAIIAVIIGIIIYKLWNWGTVVKSDFDPNNIEGGDDYIEVMDSILPVIPPEGMEIVDDGITTIVTFGNAPFADDKGSDANLANIIAQKTGATVYNCSISESYAANVRSSLQTEHPPMDAFTFYWLTTLFCVDNSELFKTEIEYVEKGTALREECEEVISTLESIDFNTVDAIAIMYDATDYYAGKLEYDGVSYTNPKTFIGNINAGIELIQKTYPHIRIILMSPTYAYYVDDNGDYLDSELNYSYLPLSSYAMILERISHISGVTFIDNFYGSVNANNAVDYLENHYQLNKKGRELIADRFIYALEYFD